MFEEDDIKVGFALIVAEFSTARSIDEFRAKSKVFATQKSNLDAVQNDNTAVRFSDCTGGPTAVVLWSFAHMIHSNVHKVL
jgi:hypothetical protein